MPLEEILFLHYFLGLTPVERYVSEPVERDVTERIIIESEPESSDQ